MRLPRRAVIGACLGILVASLAIAQFWQLPRALELSELQTVAGGAGGGVTNCDAANRTTDPGYKCGTFRSFACTNPCNDCESKTSEFQCNNAYCWYCDAGPDISQIIECIHVGDNSSTCNIFGGVAVCGVWRRSGCNWNSTTATCTCAGSYVNSGACPRKDCS